LSTDGWAEKSKSASRHGDGSDAKRSSPALRLVSVEAGASPRLGGGDLDFEQPGEELRVPEVGRPRVLELARECFGCSGEAQIGEMCPELLIARLLAHLAPPAISA
jgi:hypothetical protein